MEPLLSEELEQLGAANVRLTVAGSYFDGNLECAYRVCLWSRLANKVLLPLAQANIQQADDAYQLAVEVPWEEHFRKDSTLVVDFNGTNDSIRHTGFGAQTVKDAVIDRLRARGFVRPDVDKQRPDIRINAHLAKDRLSLALDLSGESLHRRGYRQAHGAAPLKENLASAILLRSAWPNYDALIDPMCGSGTLLIEALSMAINSAAGYLRQHWGFQGWLNHNDSLWLTLLDEAKEKRERGLAGPLPPVIGYDLDARVIRIARGNVEAAGFGDIIQLEQRSLSEFRRPSSVATDHGLMVCNPPYGERLGEQQQLEKDYLTLAKVAKANLPGWTLAVFTGNKDLAKATRLRAEKRYQFFNGAIASELLVYQLLAGDKAQLRDDSKERVPRPLSEGASMFANRLRKNQKRLAKWIRQENIRCYRIYDADMPEYAAAIDVYPDYLHVQEYAAPKTVDPGKAAKRFKELLEASAQVFDLPLKNVVQKVRKRNTGKDQYQKLTDTDTQSQFFTVQEGRAILNINLTDYLDTGLFLDHRPLRRRIANEAEGKRFLNLFCYTASATVHAALGGAASSVSVDMSNTYINWAAQNFASNHINRERHVLVKANCINWLAQCREGFDLIMLDPPSFSNSKKMEQVLDIQRDHVALIQRCMELLSPKGSLYFSCNLRSFKLDDEALAKYHVRDISEQTLDPDFANNPKIHRCFYITHS